MTTTTALPPSDASATLLNVQAVAAMLDCSVRHVYRMSDSCRLPAPVRIGTLIRWRRDVLIAWLDAGCPPCRSKRQKGGR